MCDNVYADGRKLEWFSVLDARSGYLQLKIKPSDRRYLGLETDQGNYTYAVLPYGFRVSGFQYNKVQRNIPANMNYLSQ